MNLASIPIPNNKSKCRLCFDNPNETFDIFSDEGARLKVDSILVKHFAFLQVNITFIILISHLLFLLNIPRYTTMVLMHKFANFVGESFTISTIFTKKPNSFVANGPQPPSAQIYSANQILTQLKLNLSTVRMLNWNCLMAIKNRLIKFIL